MVSDTSKQQLMEFLDWAEQKAMMRKATARALKAACKSVLSELDETEAADVLGIDLAAVVRRYENRHSLVVKPETLRTYRQRVKYAIEEFRSFSKDPSAWKPSGGQRPTQVSSKAKKDEDVGSQSTTHAQVDSNAPNQMKDASHITHRFPLRRDAFVTITGIPFNVKRGEMVRLTSFLSNLVSDEEEGPPSQPMLVAPLGESE